VDLTPFFISTDTAAVQPVETQTWDLYTAPLGV